MKTPSTEIGVNIKTEDGVTFFDVTMTKAEGTVPLATLHAKLWHDSTREQKDEFVTLIVKMFADQIGAAIGCQAVIGGITKPFEMN